MFARATFPKSRDDLIMRRLWLALCLATLSGCAATRPGVDLPELSTWERRLEVLGEATDWEFKGRIAVKAGDEGFNGKLNWTQTGDDFYVTIGGPLGIGTVTIEGNDHSVTLTDKDGLTTVLLDPEVELFNRYGWTIPVASLRYWALGIPDPSIAAEPELDGSGRLVNLEQGNWSVNISRYRENAGQQMPRLLTATNSDTRVRLVIDKWVFFER